MIITLDSVDRLNYWKHEAVPVDDTEREKSFL